VRFHITAVIVLICSIASSQNIEITGNLQLDSTWAREIFLSEIPSFQQMFTASNQLIVAGANLDEMGSFKLAYTPQHNEEKLYRVQIHKKLDPVSTITIGGVDENHIFIIAEGGDQLNFDYQSGFALFRNAKIIGNEHNLLVQEVIDLVNNQTELKREEVKSRLIEIAGTTDSECIAWFAAHNVFGLSADQRKSLNKILENLPGDSTYAASLNSSYKSESNLLFFIPIFVGFILLFGWKVYPELIRKLDQKKIYSKLSSQEMKVMGMVVKGHSNKEIASNLYIELSTVKSHVNSIYSKLNLSARKQTKRYKRLFE